MAASYEFALVGGEVLLPDGSIRQLNIGTNGGVIATLTADGIDGAETLDASGLTVVPGIIDEHFHVFRGYGWETYEGATRSAAKGGITTVVDMPLDKPATLTAKLLEEKLAAIAGECHIDYAAFGGYLEEDPDEIAAMASAGVVALKLFTGGVAPPGMYPGVDTGQMLDAMRRAKQEDLTVVVHCENAEIVDFETARLQAQGRTDPAAWDEARPWYSEVEAVQRTALVAEVTACRTVIAHMSSPESAIPVRDARARGADVWVETCPHYLCITLEQMAEDGRLKWNPPSRGRSSVDKLWELVAAGDVHAVGSDHAPLPKLPGADIWNQLPGAGNGVEAMLSLTATEALRRGLRLSRVIELLSSTPAELFGLAPRKGTIQIGSDADFAVLETNGRKTLEANELEYHEQEKWSPFDGREVTVWPVYTVLRGRIIYAEGEIRGNPGDGEFLSKRARIAA